MLDQTSKRRAARPDQECLIPEDPSGEEVKNILMTVVEFRPPVWVYGWLFHWDQSQDVNKPGWCYFNPHNDVYGPFDTQKEAVMAVLDHQFEFAQHLVL